MLATLQNTIIAALLKVMAADGAWRKRFSDPDLILKGAGVQPGQQLLEIGFGRGFFTLPLAQAIGPSGYLYALDITQVAVDYVTRKMAAAGLTNTRIFKASALNTGLPDSAVDLVLVFGVVPSPTLPYGKLLPELHRVLKPGGRLAVWTAVPGRSPASMTQGNLFVYLGKHDNVHTFRGEPL